MNLNLQLDSIPKQVLRFQLLTLLGLLVLSFISYLYRYLGFRQARSSGLWLFYVDAEKSVVTWYSASLLLLCAVLLAAIAFLKSKTARGMFAIGKGWH